MKDLIDKIELYEAESEAKFVKMIGIILKIKIVHRNFRIIFLTENFTVKKKY